MLCGDLNGKKSREEGYLYTQAFLVAGRVKNLPANSEDRHLILGFGRYPGGGNGNTLQYSCLGNPMDREAWWATVHVVAKESDTT